MLFAPKTKDKVILMVSVQSSIIRATLVRTGKGKLPLIFFNCSKSIKQRDATDSNYLVKSAVNHIKDAMEEAAKEFHARRQSEDQSYPKTIAQVHYVLSSPWIASYARVIGKKYDRPTAITKKSIKELIGREREKYLSKDADNEEIAEEKIFDIRLNGYSIPQWDGKIANTLEIAFAASIVPKNVVERFREVALHTLHTSSIYFHSSLLLHHIGVQHLLPNKDSYALVHIHGELTDVVIVEKHTCVFFGSFPVGINTVIRAIANSLGVSLEVADSYLTIYTSGKIESDSQKKVAALLNDISEGWVAEYEKLLADSGYNDRLPATAMISSRIHEAFFATSYKNKYQSASIEPIASELLSQAVAFAPKAEQLRILGLYAIALNIIA